MSDELGPARGTIEYVEILERRIKTQRDQLDALNRAMRESESNRATRKRIAALERMLGAKEFQLQQHRDAVVALNRKLAALTAPTCVRCLRDLHGYSGPLCRYCDPSADCE